MVQVSTIYQVSNFVACNAGIGKLEGFDAESFKGACKFDDIVRGSDCNTSCRLEGALYGVCTEQSSCRCYKNKAHAGFQRRLTDQGMGITPSGQNKDKFFVCLSSTSFSISLFILTKNYLHVALDI